MTTKIEKKEIAKTTQVTTLAKEKDKGANIPSKKEMDAIAHRDFTSGLITLEKLLKNAVTSKGGGKLSARALVRIIIALLQFPEENLEVNIKPGLEATAFGIGQRVQIGRFYLMMDAVQQEARRRQLEKKAKKQAQELKKEKKDVRRKEK